jgi:ubiquinone/menaquinone biosynthesis C-methylase UbiE
MSEIARVFNSAALSYDEWYAQPVGRQVFKAECRVMECIIPSEGIGLEVGAGTGIFAYKFTTSSRTVVCLDSSIGMLAEAAKRGLPSILGSATKLPIRYAVLDFTYLITVVEFLDEPAQAFKEAKIVLKRNSPLAILFINKQSPWGSLYLEMAKRGDPIFRHAKIYEYHELRDNLEKARLKVVKIIGTLTNSPTDKEAGDEIVSLNRKPGVIAIKSLPSTGSDMLTR